MKPALGNVFADTTYWIAPVVKQDQHHERAQQISLQIAGRLVTTAAVMLETANALSRPSWRVAAVRLMDHLLARHDVSVVPLASDLWSRGWELYRSRDDKAWSLTDCISFLVMQDLKLSDALTADEHFRQAGFRAVLLDDS